MFDENESKNDKDLRKQIDKGLKKLGLDDDEFEPIISGSKFSKEEFGICYNCKNLYAFKTEYGRIFGKCYEFERIMRGNDTVKYCNRYQRKGEMSIWDMKDMAIIIDIEKKKVGFLE